MKDEVIGEVFGEVSKGPFEEIIWEAFAEVTGQAFEPPQPFQVPFQAFPYVFPKLLYDVRCFISSPHLCTMNTMFASMIGQKAREWHGKTTRNHTASTTVSNTHWANGQANIICINMCVCMCMSCN